MQRENEIIPTIWAIPDLCRAYTEIDPNRDKPDIAASIHHITARKNTLAPSLGILVDFGSGPADFAIDILLRSAETGIGFAHNYDPMPAMVQAAQRNITEAALDRLASVTNRIETIEGNTADYATSHRVVNTLRPEDTSRHLDHVVRVLKPGGQYLCSIFDWNADPKNRDRRVTILHNGVAQPTATALSDGMQWHTCATLDSDPADITKAQIIDTYISPDSLIRLAAQAGLDHIKTTLLRRPEGRTPLLHLVFEL